MFKNNLYLSCRKALLFSCGYISVAPPVKRQRAQARLSDGSGELELSVTVEPQGVLGSTGGGDLERDRKGGSRRNRVRLLGRTMST